MTYDPSLFTWFFSDEQNVFVFTDLADGQIEAPETVRSDLLQRGYRSMIAAPLYARNRLLGLLTLYGEEPMGERANRYAQFLLRTLLDQVATALDRRVLLAESERRAARMATASEVARYAASVLDMETLLVEIAELIRERFDLYYVGIFIVDDSRQWAVMRSGTGEAGRAMLADGHRLPVGGDSMIGTCVATGNSAYRAGRWRGSAALR